MYEPEPVDTSDIVLSEELSALIERLASNVHDVWAKKRISEGWDFGEQRNEVKKTTPCLVPYEKLPEIEKEYDRNTAAETVKVILKLGYKIEKI